MTRDWFDSSIITGKSDAKACRYFTFNEEVAGSNPVPME
jgi:hypothetical protein